MNNTFVSEGALSAIRNNYKKFEITGKIRENVYLIVEVCATEGVVMREQVAYVLGTIWHESKFICQVERRAKEGTEVWRMQERYWHTGFYGRGFIQLTWKKNYERFGNLLGVDLVNRPELALQEDISAKIAVIGMRDGLFTGKKLSDFFKEKRKPDWINARRIVNNLFHAEEVAFAARIINRHIKSKAPF